MKSSLLPMFGALAIALSLPARAQDATSLTSNPSTNLPAPVNPATLLPPASSLSVPIPAQTSPLVPSSTVNLRPLPAVAAPAGSQPSTSYTLNLDWNQTQGNVTLQYANTTSLPVTIQGVQCTGDLFLVSYPATIAANSSGNIVVVYLAQPGTQSTADVVRLLTNTGIQLVTVAHNRPVVATLSTSSLSWEVGEAVVAKTVVLTLTNGVTVASAKAMLGSQASVQDNGNGTFTISVTPLSTAKPMTFPVIISLNPALPNATPVITCTVGS